MKLFQQIVEGWRNNLFPPEALKKKIELVSTWRMQICDGCLHNSNNQPRPEGIFVRPDVHCTSCGCTLSAKTKCFSCACPLNKWEAIATQAEWDQIKQSLGNDGI